MSFTLYTKEDCPLCEKAKVIFNEKRVRYSEKVIGKDVTREHVVAMFPWAKTAPIILWSETYKTEIVELNHLESYINEKIQMLFEGGDNA